MMELKMVLARRSRHMIITATAWEISSCIESFEK